VLKSYWYYRYYHVRLWKCYYTIRAFDLLYKEDVYWTNRIEGCHRFVLHWDQLFGSDFFFGKRILLDMMLIKTEESISFVRWLVWRLVKEKGFVFSGFYSISWQWKRTRTLRTDAKIIQIRKQKRLDGTRVELVCKMRCEAQYREHDLNIFRYFRIFMIIIVSIK
jgi:hypothetical protein